MLVDEWVATLWSILSVREKTIRDYKHLYKRHLQPLIGSIEIDLVTSRDLQIKLLSLPPQTARHTLMVAKTIWREAENYGVATIFVTMFYFSETRFKLVPELLLPLFSLLILSKFDKHKVA
jgi:hypothetical protein